jgi:hypothetical protein
MVQVVGEGTVPIGLERFSFSFRPKTKESEKSRMTQGKHP